MLILFFDVDGGANFLSEELVVMYHIAPITELNTPNRINIPRQFTIAIKLTKKIGAITFANLGPKETIDDASPRWLGLKYCWMIVVAIIKNGASTMPNNILVNNME